MSDNRDIIKRPNLLKPKNKLLPPNLAALQKFMNKSKSSHTTSIGSNTSAYTPKHPIVVTKENMAAVIRANNAPVPPPPVAEAPVPFRDAKGRLCVKKKYVIYSRRKGRLFAGEQTGDELTDSDAESDSDETRPGQVKVHKFALEADPTRRDFPYSWYRREEVQEATLVPGALPLASTQVRTDTAPAGKRKKEGDKTDEERLRKLRKKARVEYWEDQRSDSGEGATEPSSSEDDDDETEDEAPSAPARVAARGEPRWKRLATDDNPHGFPPQVVSRLGRLQKSEREAEVKRILRKRENNAKHRQSENYKKKRREYQREYDAKHREHKREYNREYDAKHREHKREYQREYDAKHKEHRREYQREYDAKRRAAAKLNPPR